MRRTRTLIAVTAAVVATVGGVTVATATADPAAEATSTRAAAQSGEVTAAAAPVATASKVSRAEAEATPTKVVWTRRSSWVTYGNTAILEGQVQITGGALPGVTVKLYHRSSTSSAWRYVTATKTSTVNGLFRLDRRPTKNSYYAVRFPGDATYQTSIAYTKVNVRRDLTPSYMTSAPRNKFYYYGSVRPSYQSKTVGLHIKTCSSCSWRYFSSTKTNSKSAWRFLLSGPSRPGREYFYRAYTPATDAFLTGYADVWSIRT